MGQVVPTGRAGGDPRDLLEAFGESKDTRYLIQEVLWDGKFLKSVKCTVNGVGPIVVKIYEKLNDEIDSKSISTIKKQLQRMREIFHPHFHPNVLPYNRWSESPKAAILIRQFVTSNLQDRQSTRPFLDLMQKRWIAYQILCGLSQAHGAGVFHGNIKAENILVSSWNWVFLVDFSPFKPTHLPLDDTSPFTYFFLGSTNRDCCCLAPERFCIPTSVVDLSIKNSSNPPFSTNLSVILNESEASEEESMVQKDTAYLENDVTKSKLFSGSQPEPPCEVPSKTTSRRSLRKQRSYTFGSPQGKNMESSFDIFSAGCVLMELFQDGEPCFGLGELLKYSQGESSNASYLSNKLDKLKYSTVRPLLQNMLDDNPLKRKTADAYLEEYSGDGKLFPAYFSKFLHPFMARLLSSEFDSPDDRIWYICHNYSSLLEQTCGGAKDLKGSAYFSARYDAWIRRSSSFEDYAMKPNDSTAESPHAERRDDENKGYANVMNSLIKQTESLLDRVSQIDSKGIVKENIDQAREKLLLQKENFHNSPSAPGSNCIASDQDFDEAKCRKNPIGGMERDDFVTKKKSMESNYDSSCDPANDLLRENGSSVVITTLCSAIRFVRFPSTMVVALRLLQRFGRYCDDETRLQLIIPYVVSVLDNSELNVKCSALRIMTSLLGMIKSLPVSDHRIFPDYIFPALVRFQLDHSLTTRLVFAECLPRLAEYSIRFLEMAWIHRNVSHLALDRSREIEPDVVLPDRSFMESKQQGHSYDADLNLLHETVQDFVSSMIEQPPVVRRTLLCDITRLCFFFGRTRTTSHMLPILITFLNERTDWQLRATFFEHIPGVAALVGALPLHQFLLPCIVQALQDVEELVIERALRCLFAIVNMGLLDRVMLTDLVSKVSVLVYHPSPWIRFAAIRLLAVIISSDNLSMVDIQVSIVDLLKPLFSDTDSPYAGLLESSKSVQENEKLIISMIKSPLSRAVFNGAMLACHKEHRAMEPGSLTDHESVTDLRKVDASSVWLKLSSHPGSNNGSQSTKKVDPDLEAQHRASSSVKSTDSKISRTADDMSKIAALAPYVRAFTEARRADRMKLFEALQELPDDYSRNISLRAQLYAVITLDQRYMTLVAHNKYSKLIENMSSSMAPASFLLIQNASFKDLVNRYGIMTRSRRHGGALGPMTSEAVSAGETRLIQRIQALKIPPLPPDMSPLRRIEDGSYFVTSARETTENVGTLVDEVGCLEKQCARDSSDDQIEEVWRPRGVLVANLYGHDGAVNRLCASQDSLFFASGSSDGTVRLWLAAGLDDGYGNRSKLTYASQGGCITDVCMIDNTHSIASASSNGSVHVFDVKYAFDATQQLVDPTLSAYKLASTIDERTDKLSHGAESSEDILTDRSELRRFSRIKAQEQAAKAQSTGSLSAAPISTSKNLAATTVLTWSPKDGAARALCHFFTATQSLVVVATDAAVIHAWDLRLRRVAWSLKCAPHVGYMTSIAVPKVADASWLVAGTSRGYVLLFDIRFQILLRAWKHSLKRKIHRLLISSSTFSDPLVFVCYGENNEFLLLNVVSGNVVHSFRTVDVSLDVSVASAPASFEAVKVETLTPLSRAYREAGLLSGVVPEDIRDKNGPHTFESKGSHSVRALFCPHDMSRPTKFSKSYLPSAILSAGTDRRIRYWDTKNSQMCYSLFDQEHGIKTKQYWDKFGDCSSICREDLVSKEPSHETGEDGRGLPQPSFNHEDAITDMTYLTAQSLFQTTSFGSSRIPAYLLTASRDGVVKVWA